jgi:hypothetical protein
VCVHCEWIVNLLAVLIVETAARSSTEHDVCSMTTPAGLNISVVCPTKLSNPSPARFPFSAFVITPTSPTILQQCSKTEIVVYTCNLPKRSVMFIMQ